MNVAVMRLPALARKRFVELKMTSGQRRNARAVDPHRDGRDARDVRQRPNERFEFTVFCEAAALRAGDRTAQIDRRIRTRNVDGAYDRSRRKADRIDVGRRTCDGLNRGVQGHAREIASGTERHVPMRELASVRLYIIDGDRRTGGRGPTQEQTISRDRHYGQYRYDG